MIYAKMPPSSERQVTKYSKSLGAITSGAVKVIQSSSKDPSDKLRDKLKLMDDVVRDFKKAARQAAREKRDKQKSSGSSSKAPAAKAKVPRKKKKPSPSHADELSDSFLGIEDA